MAVNIAHDDGQRSATFMHTGRPAALMSQTGTEKFERDEDGKNASDSDGSTSIGIGPDDEDPIFVVSGSEASVENRCDLSVLKFDLFSGEEGVHKEAQTDLGFELHDACCFVAGDAEVAITFGLVWLARQQLENISKCKNTVASLLCDGTAMLSNEVADLQLNVGCGDREINPETRHAMPCLEALRIKRTLARFRYAVQIAEAKEEGRWVKFTRRQARQRAAAILKRLQKNASFGTLGDDDQALAGRTFETFAAWHRQGMPRAAIEKLMRSRCGGPGGGELVELVEQDMVI